MNRYFRAIGFLDNFSREDYERIVESITYRSENLEEIEKNHPKYILMDKCLEYSKDIGICVRVIKDSKGNIYRESVFPYYKNTNMTKEDNCSFEKKISGEEFIGVYEDINLSENVYFFVQNADEIYKIRNIKDTKCKIGISGLSIAGNVILPIKKNDTEIEDTRNFHKKRVNLLSKAYDGDQGAFAAVKHEDILTNVTVSEQIFVEAMDIYTIVDSSFIPCGAECDLYSVLGDIADYKRVENSVTKEGIYLLDVLVKGVTIKICINEKDLFGEPQKGYRFKGTVWLQGFINSDYDS